VIAALAGGVGAARFLSGLVRTVDPSTVTAVVNTGDDDEFHGLHVSPDIDTVVYTLAGAVNPGTGWGLAGDSFRCVDALARYGDETWFRLGDLDLATHLHRTRRLREGASLSEVTTEMARAWGVPIGVVPMTDDAAPTVIRVTDGRSMPMQEWFVRHRSEPEVAGVDLAAAQRAAPAPGVLDLLDRADAVVICPSNPLISIGPVLAVPGVRKLLSARRDRVVAVSPIIGGAAVKGPADRMLAAVGSEVSCVGVARLYADVCSTIVVDEVDADLVDAVAATGVRPVVAPTLMRDVAVAAELALTTLAALAR
jgi:LPPG:FO 2-phospho-L-lactate transferase